MANRDLDGSIGGSGAARTRLRLFALAAFTALALGTGSGAAAQSAASGEPYPARSIHFVVPFPTGGFSDILGRLTGQAISEGIGKPVVVENRPGAGGNIGAELVAKAAPDGYTLLISSLNYVIAPSIYKLPFDPIADLVPVTLIADGPPQVMVVSPASAHVTVKDVIAFAQGKPGALNIATAGPGTSTHLAAAMFRTMAKVNALLVPYKGGTAEFTSVISGEAAVNFPLLPSVLSLLEGGRLRALAVTGVRRVSSLPNVPTMIESGLEGFEISNYLALMAPAKTPRSVIERLHREIQVVLKRRDFVERIERFGMQPVGSTPDEFDRYIRQQIARWADVVKATGGAGAN